MHIYGNGVHGNGLKDRNGTPFGTWQDRFIDWFRDLGFLGKPGVETKAARDVAERAAQPSRPEASRSACPSPSRYCSRRTYLVASIEFVNSIFSASQISRL